MEEQIIKLPMIALRGVVVFPQTNAHFDIGRDKSVEALNKSVDNNMDIFLATQKDNDVANPRPDQVHTIGTIAKIKQIIKLPGDNVRVLVSGVQRAEIEEFVAHDRSFEVKLKKLSYKNAETLKTEALFRKAKELLSDFKRAEIKASAEAVTALINENDAVRFVNIAATTLINGETQKIAILKENDIEKCIEKVVNEIVYEMEIGKLEKKISTKVRRSIDKSQKEYYLREQIKAIHDELGDDEEEIEELEKRIKAAKMPSEVEEKAKKELRRMGKMATSSPESAVIRTYIEWLCDIPWHQQTKDNKDLSKAAEILEQDHYGLEKIKTRILEYLAVHQLTNSLRGPILCFVGPPGVGKTSIAKSIARCLNRNFVRMSLGGVRDEAEIRGHRRTYIGSIPGKIIYQMKMAKCINPVFLLDEIDKMSSDYRGDPASAMLEVLDPEQNNTFYDHYLEVPYDLSQVMFVTTANTVDSIPTPLLDRMEVIQLSGYTEEEKIQIAKRFLIPKQMKEHGIPENSIEICDQTISGILANYTRESGVRNLEREIAALCRKSAKIIVDAKNSGKETVLKIQPEMLKEYLGVPKYSVDTLNQHDQVGTATGLAWTSVGGTTLNIDVTLMKGKGEIQLTGQLGDVMKESARTAISLIRSMASDFGIDPDVFKETDIHIHVPEGAIPKDGPSAGITIATAILSAFTEKPVSRTVAMTGEITLRGKVLAIGGLKEKTLAAHRAGIKKVIIPKENAKDMQDIPKTVLDDIDIVLTDDIKTVFKNSFSSL